MFEPLKDKYFWQDLSIVIGFYIVLYGTFVFGGFIFSVIR